LQAKKGIDPDAIPSPVKVMQADQQKHQGPYSTISRNMPPLSSTHCQIIDEGLITMITCSSFNASFSIYIFTENVLHILFQQLQEWQAL
jgi:hypothetical protein